MLKPNSKYIEKTVNNEIDRDTNKKSNSELSSLCNANLMVLWEEQNISILLISQSQHLFIYRHMSIYKKHKYLKDNV